MGRVIIIEDDPQFAEALKHVLENNHEVTIFDSVPADITTLADSRPDILFLDCMLPGENGIQFLQRLRNDERTRKLPVILMSAHYEMMDEANAMDGEFEEFLKKPCTMRQIVAVLHRYLPAPPG